MEFKGPYMRAMRERAPEMFKELCRSGKLEEHVQQKAEEAYRRLEELLAPEPKGVDGLPRDQNALRLAEERALAEMLDFPEPEKRQHRKSSDDLPRPRSRKTINHP